MNLIAFLSFTILIITILTLVFGIIAYFLYKAREKNKKTEKHVYLEVKKTLEDQYVFFEKPHHPE